MTDVRAELASGPWWKNAIVYCIDVKCFQDSDAVGQLDQHRDLVDRDLAALDPADPVLGPVDQRREPELREAASAAAVPDALPDR